MSCVQQQQQQQQQQQEQQQQQQQEQQNMEELTYITVDHSQPQPIGVHDDNLDVQYMGAKFAKDISTV